MNIQPHLSDRSWPRGATLASPPSISDSSSVNWEHCTKIPDFLCFSHLSILCLIILTWVSQILLIRMWQNENSQLLRVLPYPRKEVCSIVLRIIGCRIKKKWGLGEKEGRATGREHLQFERWLGESRKRGSLKAPGIRFSFHVVET